jgi:hypothetical protein
MPMRWTSTGVTRKRTQWSVQAQSDTGEARQLAFRTEAQARFFAAVLELGPSRLPSVSDCACTDHWVRFLVTPVEVHRIGMPLVRMLGIMPVASCGESFWPRADQRSSAS